jgi:hypothetical protein
VTFDASGTADSPTVSVEANVKIAGQRGRRERRTAFVRHP